VEKDLFEQTRYNDIEDNLTSEERKALTEFRSVSVEDEIVLLECKIRVIIL
jgi:hypothetical protein